MHGNVKPEESIAEFITGNINYNGNQISLNHFLMYDYKILSCCN